MAQLGPPSAPTHHILHAWPLTPVSLHGPFAFTELRADPRQPPDWLKNVAEDMAKKLRRYNNQVCNIFIYMPGPRSSPYTPAACLSSPSRDNVSAWPPSLHHARQLQSTLIRTLTAPAGIFCTSTLSTSPSSHHGCFADSKDTPQQTKPACPTSASEAITQNLHHA